jgi:hypothetical protein
LSTILSERNSSEEDHKRKDWIPHAGNRNAGLRLALSVSGDRV